MTSVREIEVVLARYVPLAQATAGKDITLERMVPVMAALGNPQERLKIVHIAGTSGKTSTAYYLASLLTLAGQKTGLTVSPHVDSVLERLQINMQQLGPDEFAGALDECIGLIEAAGLQATYFELLVALAYWYFDKAGVDYAVVETGMGGLHDATNIAGNPDKVCVITDIGLDHMHVLGRTVPEIARQKAGIIHAGNMVLMHEQSAEIMQVIQERCQQQDADLQIARDSTYKDEAFKNLVGYQQRNWSLAYAAFGYLQERDKLPDTDMARSLTVQVPGRMDEVVMNGKHIIMDGAHNEQKTQALVSSFQEKYPRQQVPVLLALKQGKEFAAVLPLLRPLTSRLVITAFTTSQDLPVTAIDPHELAVAARRFGFKNITVIPDEKQAFESLLAEESSVILITGSFYLIGQLRQLFTGLRPE